MTNLYFFGDSWPAEGPQIGSPDIIESYPTLVGKILNLPIKNFAEHGTSQPAMIQQLLKSNIQSGDIAIFSLTAQSRQFYYDDNGKPVNVSSHQKMSNLEFVNDYNCTWQSAQTCFVLYNICQQLEVTPCFLNTFNISYHRRFHHKLWEYIPDDVWIMPKDRFVAEKFDPEFFGQWENLTNLEFWQWLQTDIPQVHYYIKPYTLHPHINGRQKIAEVISNYIIEKYSNNITTCD